MITTHETHHTDLICQHDFREKPREEDAKLAKPLSYYKYKMKFGSDDYVVGGIRCF